ncbi:MAG: prolyl aminopeptidase [Rhodospirillales bacterium]|nr:prolyl aminopeptidase [Rhodospirillales bacterium]
MPRGDLFPEIGPFETGYLPLTDGHVMYWEQVGNPAGKPVLFLHGGPGAGAGAVHRRFFDPSIWRVIIFDQRGAGRSRPLGALENNNTPQLIQDIETLRQFMNIERMVLFGGSWGSTLALAYAQTHPERVAGAVLRGIFLGREHEVEWFLYGLQKIFPDAHAAFAEFLPPEERHDLLNGYFKRLTDSDPMLQAQAARAWSIYEGSCSTLLPSGEAVSAFAQDRTAIGLARIEAHYFRHDLFLPPGGLLAHMGRLKDIPGEIVQGRYDMICPAQSAFELATAWGQARLTLVPDAGHSALEPGVRTALIAALERCRSLL